MTEAIFLIGLTLIAVGLWMVFVPAAVIFVGLVLCIVAIAGARNGMAGKPHPTGRQ